MADKLFQWGLLLSILAGALFLAACEKSQKQAAVPRAPEVAIIEVATQPVTLTTQLPGRTSAFRIAEIRPQVNGLVLKRLFTEGSEVKAGDVLYQIDPSPFKAALDNAEASHGRAKANLPAIRLRFNRYQELLGSKAISQQEFDDAEAALKQAEAEVRYTQAAVDAARINLGFTRITAPISGRTGRSSITDGALVGAYQVQALTTIQQLDPIYVDVTQSTSELLRLKRNVAAGRLNQSNANMNKVQILFDEGTTYPLEGMLKFQDVTVDPTTGSVILRIVVPNPDNLLLPGMFVRAVIQEGVNQQGILVPQQAVSRDPKGTPLVLVVDETNKVNTRVVSVDRAIGDQWLIQSGLQPGERIIVEGIQKVRPGAVVTTVPFQAQTSANNAGDQPHKAAAGLANGGN
ncbi:MAG: efflux RND transporter periplasmic adaptor subunit [Deltaproteobacteria bacterium]|nr:efflux RND transporter periplasmic adaptor subunit [Deltaproteobacteria bacterium]